MANLITNNIRLNASTEQMESILNVIRRDGDVYGSFDFNKLIPMPEGLDLTEGRIKDDAVVAFISHMRQELAKQPTRPGILAETRKYLEAAIPVLKKPFFPYEPPKPMSAGEIQGVAFYHEMSVDDFLALGKQYLDNQLQHGAPTWYHWAIKNWGTKWNTHNGNVLESENTLRFETAWSAPHRILEALSKQFPDVKISHEWADENVGHNVGLRVYLAGAVIESHIPDGGSKEAYDLAFNILDIDPADRCLRYDIKAGTYVFDESLEENFEHNRPALDNVLDLAKAKAALCADADNSTPNKDNPER